MPPVISTTKQVQLNPHLVCLLYPTGCDKSREIYLRGSRNFRTIRLESGSDYRAIEKSCGGVGRWRFTGHARLRTLGKNSAKITEENNFSAGLFLCRFDVFAEGVFGLFYSQSVLEQGFEVGEVVCC